MSSPASGRPGATPSTSAAGAPLSYAAAVVHYRDYARLDACLASLASQTRAPDRVVVLDADGDPAERRRLAARHPRVVFDPAPNLGYAGGANRVLEAAREGADFVLLLNPDVVLAADFAAQLLEDLAERPGVALACGRLSRPDGRLDSAGIEMPRNRRPRDRGSGEPDRGQYAESGPVFGASGAALLVRCRAADDLQVEGQLFDEDFFVYHEDTDLSWRAALFGWEVRYVAGARGVHDRGWRAERRFRIAPGVRRHSFKNHYLEMIKNERPGPFFRDLPVILAWEVLRLGFALLRDRAMLRAYGQALALAPAAWRRRRWIQGRARRARQTHPSGPASWPR